MLNESDQYKLRQRSTWDEDTREWKVPLFIFNKVQDEVAFPTLGAKARVQQARDDRHLAFPSDGGVNGSHSSRSRSKYDRETFSDMEHDGGHAPHAHYSH